MDLPTGTPIREGMEMTNVDFRKLFAAFRDHGLTGYLVLDIMTNNGIEEGTLLFSGGDVIGAEYDYVAKGKVLKGDEALSFVMNACMGDGRFDVVQITAEEFISTREGNRECVMKYKPTDAEVMGMLPDTFSEQRLEEKAVKVAPVAIAKGTVSREEVLKKYNITHPDQKMLDKLLEGIAES